MMRRTLLHLALLSVLGCGGADRAPGTVEIWTLQLSPAFDEHMHASFHRFESEHPGLRVRWIDVPYEGFTQKFLAALSAGEAPDVINVPADLVRQYHELEALAGLDTLLPGASFEDHLPAALEPMRIDSMAYGVPWYLATKVLIADTSAFRSAGLLSEMPVTFEGVMSLAEAYRERTGRPGLFFNLVVDSYLLQVFESEGIPVLSSDGRRAVFATPEAARILDRWRRAFERGALPRESLMAGHQGGIDLYQAGAVPMFIGAPQFLRIIEQNAPARFQRTIVAPAPVGSAGWKELDVMALAVTSTTREPAGSSALVAFLTSAGWQTAFAELVPVFPSNQTALRDPFFTSDDGTITSRARRIAASQLGSARVLRPSMPHYPRLREIFKDHLLGCFLGRRTAAEALAAAQSQWNEVLQEP